MSGLDTYFLEVSAQGFLKIATKGSFRCEKSRGYFSEAKTEEYY